MSDKSQLPELIRTVCSTDAGEGLRHQCSPASGLTQSFDVNVPPDLQAFWDEFGGMRLFEDTEYGQWGLVLWGNEQVRERQETERASLVDRDAYRDGDLVIGEFLGDADKLLVRCDPRCEDFGAVLVVIPVDRREDWPQLWPSLEAFIAAFVDHNGEKYWPH